MKNPRRAYTLIECLLLFVLVGAALMTITSALYTLRRADQRLRDQLTQEHAIQRLAQQLRQDAHLAVSTRLGAIMNAGDSRTITLALNDQKSIQYTVAANQIIRLVVAGEAVQHSEHYSLTTGGSSRWEIDTARERPLVTLWLPFSDTIPASNLYRIQAAVGLGPG